MRKRPLDEALLPAVASLCEDSQRPAWRGVRRVMAQSGYEEILILGQYFHPEIGGTAQRLTELAVDLRKMGMRVRVITGQPSYLARARLPRREVHEGVEIERLPQPHLPRDRPLARIAGALIFFALALVRLMGAGGAAPLLIVTNPPILPLVGLILKKLRGHPYVCLVHDIYPEIAVRLGYFGRGSVLVRVWETLNARAYSEANAVIVLSRCMADTIERQQRARHRDCRIQVIHNWADAAVIVPRPKEDNWMSARYGTIGKVAVVYSGNLGQFHEFNTLLEAARLLREEERILFLFIGDGGKRQYVVETADRWKLKNVTILPYQPSEDVPYTLTCGDFAAVTMAKGTEGLCMPGKLYTALAAGQAILAITGKTSELGAIVTECGCGYRIEQGDAEGVVEVLRRSLDDPEGLERMKRRSRRCFEERFTRRQASHRYYEVLTKSLTGRRDPSLFC